MNWQKVEAAVAAGEQQATVGVSIQAPDGERWSHNGDQQFPAASTVKIPIMIEVFRKIERGEISLNDPCPLKDTDKVHGSGVLLHMHEGLDVTVADLLYLMISISDNTATNMLIELGVQADIQKTMQELGMAGSSLNRPMLGRPAGEGDPPENYAAPDDYVTCIRAILDNKAASADSCQAMIELLEKQQNQRRIGRYVPDSDEYRWGSKTGSLKGISNDTGFVTGPAGTLVIAVYLRDLQDPITGEQIIANITRAALEASGLI